MTWTDEHGEDGLRHKFDVYKPRDRCSNDRLIPSNAYNQEDRIGADGEFVFVLRPETDKEAWFVLDEYASRVRPRSPQLAEDIQRELRRIGHKNREVESE